jgi:Mrp family chromosome partitioning ATPase
MSRNFEMLQQAEHSRTLFQSPVALPPLPTPHVVPERAEPEQQETEQHSKEERVMQVQSGDDHPLEVAKISQGVEWLPWKSWLRMGIKWLGIRSNGQINNSRGRIDYKSMALQEEIKLVERVFLGPDSGSNRVILFSGVDKAEGGARVCAQAAQTLAAQVQGTVCMIDADLHSRSLQNHLGVRNTPGLSEAVLQNTSIRHYAQPLAFSNLWMITCGGDGANSQTPLNSDLMRMRFEELRRQFDYVLINAPSLGMTANLTQFAQLADGVIFVVEANSTRRETTKRFKESLEEVRVRVLGVVMNDRTFPIPESVYRKL